MNGFYEKILNEMGYKKHVSKNFEYTKYTDTLFQKKIKDEKGIRYYINVWWYKEQTISGNTMPEAIQSEVQFYDKNNNAFMNVEIPWVDQKEAEKHFDHIWKTLELGYYELYE